MRASQVIARYLAYLWVSALLIPGPYAGFSAALPKIRVSKDGHGFITEKGAAFIPFGVSYYRPGTGWAPQVWKKFDAEATRKDFARMKELGVNCVRVFLTYGSFYTDSGQLRPEGLEKFDTFLALAEEAGIYVHPTGPDHWEGMPHWRPVSIEDEQTLAALEAFWRLFAARYRGRNVIFAYDLKNEPEVPWTSEILKKKWQAWIEKQPSGVHDHAGAIPADAAGADPNDLLAYQALRETCADEWTRRQTAAIKSADPEALVTVGLIQWSVPYLLPGSVRHYSGFRPERQARYLDFLEIHFYPLARGAYEYRSEGDENANLAYAECLVREVARSGKPVVMAEFGWYGGGKPTFDRGSHPEATEEQQAQYCAKVVQTTAGPACGWLNWGFYDHPEASDCSQLTGLLTARGQTKAWGKVFKNLAIQFARGGLPRRKLQERPKLAWDECLTSLNAEAAFRNEYFKAFQQDAHRAE